MKEAQLHERIRELEAELAEYTTHPLRSPKDERNYWYSRFREQRARAEKAEARVAELEAREKEE